MKWHLFASCLVVIVPGAIAVAQEGAEKTATKTAEHITRLQRFVDETKIDTTPLQKRMPLAKFLAAVEGQLSPESKISLRLDAAGLGKDLNRVGRLPVDLNRKPDKVSFDWVLRRVLKQVSEKVEVEYAFRPDGIVITRPPLATHESNYDVRELVGQVPELLPTLNTIYGQLDRDPNAKDGLGLLIALLTNQADLRHWETIEVQNGGRLVVRATRMRHHAIADLIDSLRRLVDVRVVMNARLYEVDRDFYGTNIAPLLAAGSADQPSTVVPIEGPLFKKIVQQKALLESEHEQLRPNQSAAFLARQDAYRFAAGLMRDFDGRNEPRPRIGTGLAGVSFEVRPLVSPDRRFLRLEIAQQNVQLAGLGKARKLDIATGKEVEIETPNVRRTTVQGTVQVPDGNPIVMPVEYRPPGKENADKVWLLVARPFIWIEDEVKEIRKAGGDLTPRSVWESDVLKEEPAAVFKPLTFNDDVRQVLQAVVADVLTNPALKGPRDFYGTTKDKTFTLVDSEDRGWPKQFRPETDGWKLVPIQQDPFVRMRRVLGIRIDKFDLKQKKSGLRDTPIEVCLFNAGGNANGGTIGGCSVYYEVQRVAKGWKVEFSGLLDP